MASATKAISDKKGTTNNLLRGSDLPAKQREVTVKFRQVREAPDNFNSPLIADLDEEPVAGKTSLPLNITNIRALVEFLGDNYEDWAGASVTLAKIQVNNPQTNTNTWGLRVVDATKPRKRPQKKQKTKQEDDEVPF